VVDAGGGDDDDDLSRADSTSTLASGTVATMSKLGNLDQDLGGFEPALDAIRSAKESGGGSSTEAATGELIRVSEGIEGDDDESRRASPEPHATAERGTGTDAASARSPNGSNRTVSADEDTLPSVPSSLKSAEGHSLASAGPMAANPAPLPGDVVLHLGEVGGGALVPASGGLDVAPSVTAAGNIAQSATIPSLKTGWLRKRAVSAPTMLKNWRLRYVVLSPMLNSVLWYKTPDSPEPQGKLSLDCADNVACTVSTSSESSYRLHVCAGRRELVLEAENHAAIEEWRQAVQAVLDQLHADRTTPPPTPPPSGCSLL